ncbi:MAG: TonB family protein, partial [Myxococcales bacterium]|nr:TonB family protein [Myxococcales bacterium]
MLGICILWASVPVRAQTTESQADGGVEADAAPDPSADTAPDPTTDTEQEQLHPPHLLAAPAPQYPPGREEEGLHPTVILRITVTAAGDVADVVVEHSAGLDFDAEAVRAVRGWAFDPATRGDTPVSSRIRVAVHFEPPTADAPHEGDTHEPQDVPHVTPAPPPPNVPAAVAPATPEPDFEATAEVDAEKLRAQDRGAADFTIDRKILDAAPALTA